MHSYTILSEIGRKFITQLRHKFYAQCRVTPRFVKSAAGVFYTDRYPPLLVGQIEFVKMKVEDVIPLVGNFGRYQLFMVLYTGCMNIVACMITFSHVFFAAETDHWCKVLPTENCSSWAEFQDNCTDVKKSILLPPPEGDEGGNYPHSNCKQWELPPGYEFDPYEPFGKGENFTNNTVPCLEGWEYDTSQYKTTIITDVSRN